MSVPAHTARRLAGVAAALTLALAPAPALAARGHDGGDRVEVETSGRCGGSSRWQLELRAEDGTIEVRADVRLRPRRAATVWRAVSLHERRIVQRRTIRVSRLEDHVRVRLQVPDFAGSDAILVRFSGPAGETCSAAAVVGRPS